MSCPYCNSTQYSLLYNTYPFNNTDYSFAKCKQCECIYLSPIPDVETLNLAYSSQYYGEGDSKFIKPVEKVIGLFLRQRASLVHSLLKGKGSVLDMGCGNGKFLNHVSQMGDYKISGIERPGNSANRAKSIDNLTLYEGEIDHIEIDNKFDAITLFHVFEHLPNPSIILAKIDDLLKPGGFVVITVPNIGSIQSAMFKGYWFHLDIPRHLFFFRPKRFIKLMNERAYKLVGQSSFSLEHSIWGFIQSVLNVVFPSRDLYFEILKGNKALLKRNFLLFIIQSILIIFLLPFAVIEYVFSGIIGRGVHKQFVFKKEKE